MQKLLSAKFTFVYDLIHKTVVTADLKPLQRLQLTRDDEQRPAIAKCHCHASLYAAFVFIGRVALTAETANHHPDY